MSAVKFFVPNPQYLSFVRWSSILMEELSQYNLTIPTSEDNWKLWATTLISIPSLAPANLPDPRSYDHWQDWASRCVPLSQG